MELTKSQLAKVEHYLQKWAGARLSTDRMNVEISEAAIKELYKFCELDEPIILTAPCPVSGAIIAAGLALGITKGNFTIQAKDILDVFSKQSNQIYKNLPPELLNSIIENSLPKIQTGLDFYKSLDVEWNKSSINVFEASQAYFGGSLWPGYASWTDFYKNEVGVDLPNSMMDLVQHCGHFWCLYRLVILTDKPTVLQLDDANNPNARLHSVTGPALAHTSGYELYFVKGVMVPKSVVMEQDKITPKLIDSERNAEIRRVMMELYGVDRYFKESNPEILHEDVDPDGFPRQLLRIKQEPDEDIVRVKVYNSTPNPDGTRNIYFLPVHPQLRPLKIDTKATLERNQIDPITNRLIPVYVLGNAQEFTCRNAAASSFGLYGHEYEIPGQARQGDVLVTSLDPKNKTKFVQS